MIENQTSYQPHNKMREIIRDNSQLLLTISRFDIAFGFGESTIEKTCQANHVDTDTFITVCNFLSGAPYNKSAISLHSLMNYLKATHASIMDVTLPNIRRNLIEAINYLLLSDKRF